MSPNPTHSYLRWPIALCLAVFPAKAQAPISQKMPSPPRGLCRSRSPEHCPLPTGATSRTQRSGLSQRFRTRRRRRRAATRLEHEAYVFLSGDAPPTVNPSLWRQAQLNAIHGLFKVTDRLYQVRGFDILEHDDRRGRSVARS